MTDHRARYGPHNPDDTCVSHDVAEHVVDLGELPGSRRPPEVSRGCRARAWKIPKAGSPGDQGISDPCVCRASRVLLDLESSAVRSIGTLPNR